MISVVINETKYRQAIEKLSKAKCSFFEKIYKINYILARLVPPKKRETQITKIRNERGSLQILQR